MLLAGLIDLGANFQEIKEKLIAALKLIPDVKHFNIECKKVVKNGINATQIRLSFKENTQHRHGKELQDIMRTIITSFNWNKREEELALNILNTLIRAEAKIHGTSENHVHLHETGSIDTIIDIVGFILACQNLQLFDNCIWITTPVAVGGGLLKFSHGLVSNPAPATLEILQTKKIEILGGPIESELTTPTGASILVNIINKNMKFYPPLIIQSIGYGAGTKDFPNIPNVLRLIQGKKQSSSPYNFERPSEGVWQIETNVDDVTGELLGNTIKKLTGDGLIKDISVIPTTLRKRVGYIIQIIASYDNLLPITDILINELGTLGVRFFPVMRYTLNRKIISLPVQILNEKYNISIKISWDTNKTIIQAKPESDEVLIISQKTSLPMRKILQIINKELEKQYPLGEKLSNSTKN